MDKKVNILLAVYNPKINWLSQLLTSLNDQTYKNIEITVYDDCPENYTSEDIFAQYITNFPYKIIRAEKNSGSNKAFEYLTQTAEGDYFAYCDQDDIWHNDKIEKMMYEAINKNAELVCCDLAVIDSNSNVIYDTYRKVSKRHIFEQGSCVYNTLLIRNFAIGCASLFKAETAKKAVPFCNFFYHDHWLALIASLNGYVAYIDESLIDYRIHGNNQTGVFLGIETKKDYFEKRIEVFYLRTKEMTEKLKKYDEIKKQLAQINIWADARYKYFNKFGFSDMITIFKYRKFGRSVALFEILMKFMPSFIFNILINKIKKGII